MCRLIKEPRQSEQLLERSFTVYWRYLVLCCWTVHHLCARAVLMKSCSDWKVRVIGFGWWHWGSFCYFQHFGFTGLETDFETNWNTSADWVSFWASGTLTRLVQWWAPALTFYSSQFSSRYILRISFSGYLFNLIRTPNYWKCSGFFLDPFKHREQICQVAGKHPTVQGTCCRFGVFVLSRIRPQARI